MGYVILALVFWGIGFYFYKRTRIYQKNIIDIKKNGKVLDGTVVHIIRVQDYNTTNDFTGVEYEEKKSILDMIILIVFFIVCGLVIYFQVLKS